ncbi:uncharacterized protein LOC113136229 isoform X2 [Mastacembelus armatus]|uniref:Uncharacterized LOC113136229 n=1 Tax=Mastacembelus armatus TaxID=205130 RepID=A0A3Q3LTL7_9TELE|nr:uncharacterized protein LOC113136229 isoform X2 [Mastacembelus armatus]
MKSDRKGSVLLSAIVQAQNPVPIQFQANPVLLQTGTEIVFTVLTVPQILFMEWRYKGDILVIWTGGAPTFNPVPQFQGRVTITATQLKIGSAQLRDAGNYTLTVIPLATTGLAENSGSVQLRVFDAVAGVNLVVPSVAVEDGNVSLSCTWTAGTELTVQWSKDGTAITANPRITISRGSLIISPALRGDTGKYTCTVSNPVSAQTATQTLTIYYGPDTPVLTKESSKQCVGGGDVLVGQAVRLTCTSASLPPALFSWQYKGQPVTPSQSDSGMFTLQTFTTNQSGQYACIARNSVTGRTSQQTTALAIVDICLSVGEVVGIVIGSLLLLLIIVLLIIFIIYLIRRRRAQGEDTVVSRKTNLNTRPIPPDPQPNGARELGQGPQPPLYHTSTHMHQPDLLHTALRERHNNPQTLPLNSLHNSDTHQQISRTHTNGLLQNAIQNTNSYPHNGIDNPAFMHSNAQNTNTLPNTQQQNPNILIQAGTAQGTAQPPAVHVSLNTLPPTAEQNSNAQMPTINVNLNSYSTHGQQIQQDSSLPLTNTANNAPQTQQNLMQGEQSNPRGGSGQSYPNGPRMNGHTSHQAQPGLIPTGYTHYNSHNTFQQNANTQTYQQDTEPRNRSDRNSGRRNATPSSTRQQIPWDLLRGTPAYPRGTLQRESFSPDLYSDSTDYTVHPPIREARTLNRSQPQQTTSQSRTPTRQDVPSVDRQTRSRLDDRPLRIPQLEPANHTHSSPRTHRESAQQDIRDLPGSQTALRHEATHSSNPQALPLMSQQAPVGRSVVSREPTTQLGMSAPWGTDTRALADPNHLPQVNMAQQHRGVPIRTSAQGLGRETLPVIHQYRQGGTAPVSYPSAQVNPSNLTQTALKAHTEKTQTFQNRRQQTQAALLHPGAQPIAPAAEARHPPTPPPVIPLTQFQTIPKEHKQHKSPIRGPQPPRPPVNIPVAQRHPRHTLNVKHHHQRPGNGHMHVSAHRHAHAPTHGHPAHFTHQQQQQAHRGRPR